MSSRPNFNPRSTDTKYPHFMRGTQYGRARRLLVPEAYSRGSSQKIKRVLPQDKSENIAIMNTNNVQVTPSTPLAHIQLKLSVSPPSPLITLEEQSYLESLFGAETASRLNFDSKPVINTKTAWTQLRTRNRREAMESVRKPMYSNSYFVHFKMVKGQSHAVRMGMGMEKEVV